MRKPILCLDFDGVIHSYSSGWSGADTIPDPPVAGAVAFMLAALRVFDVAIFSSRSNQLGGINAMRSWLKKHAGQTWYETPDGPGLEDVRFPTEKPAALVSIDDRALTFDGTWPRIEDLRAFKPWNKRPTGATGDFQQGALNAVDQGGLNIAIGCRDGVVCVEFGKPVAWLGLDKATAYALADNLKKWADTISMN